MPELTREKANWLLQRVVTDDRVLTQQGVKKTAHTNEGPTKLVGIDSIGEAIGEPNLHEELYPTHQLNAEGAYLSAFRGKRELDEMLTADDISDAEKRVFKKYFQPVDPKMDIPQTGLMQIALNEKLGCRAVKAVHLNRCGAVMVAEIDIEMIRKIALGRDSPGTKARGAL